MLSQIQVDAVARSVATQHVSGPFEIISPDSDLGFCSRDLPDSC